MPGVPIDLSVCEMQFGPFRITDIRSTRLYYAVTVLVKIFMLLLGGSDVSSEVLELSLKFVLLLLLLAVSMGVLIVHVAVVVAAVDGDICYYNCMDGVYVFIIFVFVAVFDLGKSLV